MTGVGMIFAATVGVGLVLAVSVVSLARGFQFDTGPGRGTHSAHLAIQVSPATGLDDGSKVLVTSRAFGAKTVVGIAVCLSEADTKHSGVEACDTVAGSRFATDAKGVLAQPFAVPRVITVGGTAYDCATRPGRCVLVAASSIDFDRSGGQPISFRTGLAPSDLTPHTHRPYTDHLPITAEPIGPSVGPTRVRVHATGFRPREPLVVALCTRNFATTGPTACMPSSSGAVGAVMFGDLSGPLPHADETGAYEGLVTTAREVTSFEREGFDCTSAPGRCSIVIAAAADTKRSAVLPYTITSG